ncbi:MAG: hypothetical protein FD149_198 [Rhodospirillaceae bacterium]|nr:MAG: hypothetical protein FD149_198 [Rhodospirillaceae bacterium]
MPVCLNTPKQLYIYQKGPLPPRASRSEKTGNARRSKLGLLATGQEVGPPPTTATDRRFWDQEDSLEPGTAGRSLP